MNIQSQLPVTRTQSDIDRLREKIRIATVRGIKPDANCEACKIARRHGTVVWCRCIGKRV